MLHYTLLLNIYLISVIILSVTLVLFWQFFLTHHLHSMHMHSTCAHIQIVWKFNTRTCQKLILIFLIFTGSWSFLYWPVVEIVSIQSTQRPRASMHQRATKQANYETNMFIHKWLSDQPVINWKWLHFNLSSQKVTRR